MQKTDILYFFAILIFTFCICNSGDGQATRSDEAKGDPSINEKPAGFYNVTTFSPVTFPGQFLSGVQTIFGYRVTDHFSVGGGIGFERFTSLLTFDNFKANFTLFPVFADIRYTFLKRTFSPVLAMNGGYKFLLKMP